MSSSSSSATSPSAATSSSPSPAAANSENVIRAVSYANEIGCETLGLCGFSGGRLKQTAKQVIWVGVDDMQLCEDVHALFGHMVMQTLCGYGRTAQ